MGSTHQGISKIRNICVITGRTRAVVQKYKMSRIQFKQNAEAGLIPGIKKL
jgi:small subunit ribosomal protein S14